MSVESQTQSLRVSSPRPSLSSLWPLSLMNFITKRKSRKLFADRRKKAKQPKFKDKDLKRMSEFDIVPGIGHYNAGWNTNYGSAYIEDEDDTSSISSCSTNATMDNIPGTGRTIDMCFYQPVGRAIERIALRRRWVYIPPGATRSLSRRSVR